MKARTAALGTATFALVFFAGWLVFRWGGPHATLLAGRFGAIAFSVFATVATLIAGLRGIGPARVAWLCLAGGLAGWVAGDLLLAYATVTGSGRPLFPSPADFAYLLLPVGACAATVFAPVDGKGRSGIRLLLDGVIVSSSLFLVAWTTVLQRLHDTISVGGFDLAVALTYPFADLAMITTTCVVLSKAGRDRRLSPLLLLMGFTSIGVAHVLFFYRIADTPYDPRFITLGKTVGMFFIAAAALSAKRTVTKYPAPSRRPSRLSLLVPYLPVPFAVALGATALWPVAGTSPVLIAGLLLIAAALLRQFILLDENQRLLVTVADIALRDPLTGLPNRELFSDRLAHAMQLRLRNAAPVGVLVLDLDDFKLVNDSMGHPAGDSLLRNVGERIQGATRDGDTVARLGGDEFAVLIEDQPATAHEVAERVVEAFDDPFDVDGRQVYVRPSVGLAVAPSVGEPDMTADDLLRRSDLAMYSAKRANFSGVRTFTSDMQNQSTQLPLGHRLPDRRTADTRIHLLADLRRAIDERRLALVYQPKFSLRDGHVAGVEALVRWPHPNLGTLEPADFMPLIRQNGLMDALTEFVMDRAVEQAARWQAAGIEVPVAINLAAPSLNDEGLPDQILSVLDAHAMPPSCLMVEITEDQLLASVMRTRTVLDRLRAQGIRVALDDFGSGYSTMALLRELPIDELKMDRQFVAPIMYDERAAAIVQSVIDLADTFGIASVAEGVENKETADRLRKYGCGFVQGHYFSPPVSAEAIGVGILEPQCAGNAVKPIVGVRPSWA